MAAGDAIAWVVSLRDQFIFFSCALSAPSFLLYAAQIVTILRHDQFHNAFFVLFIARAVPDAMCSLMTYFGYCLPAIFGAGLRPLYARLPNWALVQFYFLGSYGFEADNLATALITLNRLTAVLLPTAHKQLWRKWLPLAVAAIFAVPLATSVHVLRLRPVLSSYANSSAFVILEDPNEWSVLAQDNLVKAVWAALFLVFCILANLAAFRAYRKQNANQQAKQSTSEQRKRALVERKLFVYAIATFAGHALVALLMIGLYACWEDGVLVGLLYSQYPWVINTGTVVLSSWLLLWASDSFRAQLFADWVPRCCCSGAPSAHTSSGQNNLTKNKNNNENNGVVVRVRPSPSAVVGPKQQNAAVAVHIRNSKNNTPVS